MAPRAPRGKAADGALERGRGDQRIGDEDRLGGGVERRRLGQVSVAAGLVMHQRSGEHFRQAPLRARGLQADEPDPLARFHQRVGKGEAQNQSPLGFR